MPTHLHSNNILDNAIMTTVIETKSELCAIKETIDAIVANGKSHGRYTEIQTCIICISYDQYNYNNFIKLKDKYIETTKFAGESGWNKGLNVYCEDKDRIVKPSYKSRLEKYTDHSLKNKKYITINQIETISKKISEAPGYSCLTFTISKPADLIDMYRPSYVPCIIGGDIKVRDNKVNLSVMFRTNDALSMLYSDLFHLRSIQQDITNRANKLMHSKLDIGNINLFLSKTHIRRIIKDKNKTKYDGILLAKNLSKEIEMHKQDEQINN